MNIIVFVTQLTNRVEYIFSTLLADIGFEKIMFTTNIDEYNLSDCHKINYSNQPIHLQELWIVPVGLLFETDIKVQYLQHSKWKSLPCFFLQEKGDVPFDVFAASFFLLSRYEEYLPHTLDTYGRYAHTNSIAYNKNFLNVPLINLWMQELKKLVIQKFPQLKLGTTHSFSFVPTYDIDIAWCYLHKGFVRNIGGLLKDLLKLNWFSVNNRIQVLLRKKTDPFDSYTWLQKIHSTIKTDPIYFFLVPNKNKGYDKNILPHKTALQQLIKELSQHNNIGIHPSWQSNYENTLNEEISTLQNIIEKKVTQSRQHFIKLQLPETYRQLLTAGITHDYSMGYGSINGFRASYCKPYKWFDVSTNQITSLTIHPFFFMDANSFFEQKYTPEQALSEMSHYFSVVKQVQGELIFIWHNHLLGTHPMFTGWRNVYATFLEDLIQQS